MATLKNAIQEEEISGNGLCDECSAPTTQIFQYVKDDITIWKCQVCLSFNSILLSQMSGHFAECIKKLQEKGDSRCM